MTPEWLKNTVFYEIYPQSFQDSDGDGIGDLKGIISRLDYIRDLGCNALWINPIFDSPFMDAGYDVRDYKKIAPRYGTMDDFLSLLSEAHSRGIRVLLDLVPGHTSDQHEWFLRSCEAEPNEYSGRYVWTDGPFVGIADHPYISGMKDRAGSYMLNFFASQPALNYGWLDHPEKWMSSPDSPEAHATREAIKDVMRFWLDKGCDGFRVDMADSLVKNDDSDKHATAAVWKDIREMLDRGYPEAALVSEWSNPYQSICLGGFHMDFYLDHHGNGYNTLLRDYETGGDDRSYFRKDSGGTIERFLQDYLPKYEASKDLGYISMFTCNHDTPRPAATLSPAELKLAYAFILTMPGVPFIYYGDEIGMRYLDVRTKEGGYARCGSRTPMQWNSGRNMGFSEASENELYLPQDPAEDAPNAEDQLTDPDSLLSETRRLVALRHRYEDLQAAASFVPLWSSKEHPAFVYGRGGMVLAVNPSSVPVLIDLPAISGMEICYSISDCTLEETQLRMSGQSFSVITRKEI